MHGDILNEFGRIDLVIIFTIFTQYHGMTLLLMYFLFNGSEKYFSFLLYVSCFYY